MAKRSNIKRGPNNTPAWEPILRARKWLLALNENKDIPLEIVVEAEEIAEDLRTAILRTGGSTT